MFSDELQRLLQANGWSPDRTISTDRWLEVLERQGFTPIPEATRILSNLGGLTIVPQSSKPRLFAQSNLQFDPLFAADGEFDRVEQWQDQLQTKLFPIAHNFHCCIIMCSLDGAIISGRMKNLRHLGATIEAALELELFARTYPKWLAGTRCWWEKTS